MFWMGRRGRGMGGLFLFPGILFGLYAILAVLNVAGIVIGAVFSGLAAAFSGVISGLGGIFSGAGSAGGLIVGAVIGVALFYYFRNRKMKEE